jgi:co-chaperonin GroES (HSP10)|tara:strand:+ start:32215 stop:32541 length:327 start_codon:yes stop_codon:yes gene_type:complete
MSTIGAQRLKPVNRHLVIVPHVQKNETNSGVLLPDDFSQEEDRYISASVVDIASDCSSDFQRLRRISHENNIVVVDRGMIEEVKLNNKTHYIVLENYVIGILRGLDED